MPTENLTAERYLTRMISDRQLSTLYALPRNEMEKSLVQIWEEVLGVRPIGIQDKFFDLGGHSLSATRVCLG